MCSKPTRHPYSTWRWLLSWVLSPPYIVLFFSTLCLFDVLQKITFPLGYSLYIKVFNLMNFCLITNFRFVGTRITVQIDPKITLNSPIIFVSNHQSMYDVPFLIWNLRESDPKFISKVELSRRLPGISFALRRAGHALIDRANPRQAIPAIKQFGAELIEQKRSAVIFPEGTRARDGKMKSFKLPGFSALLDSMPNCTIVPVALDGSWELVRYNLLPIICGVKLSMWAMEPISREFGDAEKILAECEKRIGARLSEVRNVQHGAA